MTEHETLRTSLGAYVLGGLPEDEAVALEAHLAGCAGCRAELDELVGPARLLAELRDGAPAEPEPPRVPAGLQDRVVTAVAAEHGRERRTAWRRRASLAAVAGAAAAAVAVAGLVVVRPGDDAAPAVPLEDVTVAVGAAGLRADAELVDHTWGVEVLLTASGFEQGRRYAVVVVGTDGRRHPAGGFVGTGEREMLCRLNSPVLRAAASGFEVRDRSGRVVARSSFA